MTKRSTQLFHRGDVVKVADDLGPSMSHFYGAGESAFVIGSYFDQFGGSPDSPNGGHSYTLMFPTHGEVSWYYESQLTLLRLGAPDEIAAAKAALEAQHEQEADLDWILAHWKENRPNLPGASCDALMKLCGIDNPWGAHGEGYTWYRNAISTLAVLEAALDSGDKAQVLARADEVKAAILK